jgi:hypothetical protein
MISIRADYCCPSFYDSSIQPLVKQTAFINAVAIELLFLAIPFYDTNTSSLSTI